MNTRPHFKPDLDRIALAAMKATDAIPAWVHSDIQHELCAAKNGPLSIEEIIDPQNAVGPRCTAYLSIGTGDFYGSGACYSADAATLEGVMIETGDEVLYIERANLPATLEAQIAEVEEYETNLANGW